MSRRILGSLSLALGLALLLAQSFVGPLKASRSQALSAAVAAQHVAISSNYGQLPLAFELNEGQAAGSARFLAHGSGYTLALTPSAALLALSSGAPITAKDRVALPAQPHLAPQAAVPPTVVSMQWLGANPIPVVTGEQPLPGTVNYFIGNDPKQWHTNIPTYQQVRLHDVYPGVDLVYYGNAGQLEYDFVVAPGASPAAIQLGFTGASGLGVDLLGNLSLTLPGGALQQDKPLAYQQINGTRQVVAGGYTLTSGQRIAFRLGAYDARLPLVIDPAYKFSTFLGGSDTDYGTGIAVDASGNAYVTGSTDSTNFPTVNALQASNAGGYDAFVSKFNAAGTALVYSTYLGGLLYDNGFGIAVDASGNAYVTGSTDSTNFPTVNALQASNGGNENAFVSKLNASGSALVYSTYLGGHGNTYGYGIAVDASGNAYLTGSTDSTNFPTHNPLQASNGGGGNNDAFVSKFNAAGSALVYSTYLGGFYNDQGNGIAVDASGNAYVAGYTFSTDFPTASPLQANKGGSYDAFVSKVNAAGSALVYSSYLGGSNDDYGYGIAVDASGNAYVTGGTTSTNFPTANALQASFGGVQDAFVSKFNAAGSALIYSTYLGGTADDQGNAIAVDASGNAYVTGHTASPNFPTHNPLQANFGGATFNAFVSKFNAAGSALAYSSYLGGSLSNGDEGAGIAVGTGGNTYVTGYTYSANFPTVNALQASIGSSNFKDAFVTKLLTLPSVDTTTGVFRPSNGTLYLKNANTTGPADITLDYGLPGDQPITGDWTGKGYKSIGVYRGGTFYLRNSNTTGYADIVVPFGASTDIPVAGDWTGKGYDSIGVYRPSTNTFLLRNSNTAGPPDITARLGISGDVPIVGDWTGKGWDSLGVFRPSNGIVYLRNSNTTGVADINFVYGIAGDKPVVGDWDGNGTDTIGVDRGGRFLLRNSNSTGPANFSFYLGVAGDDPIAGPWLAPASAPPPVHRGPGMPTPAGQHGAATPMRRGMRE
jgi:hypothetical protein